MDQSAIHELLCQVIETELAGERIYEAAIENAVNTDLREEWETYLDETRHHQQLLHRIFAAGHLDIDEETESKDHQNGERWAVSRRRSAANSAR